MKKDITKPIPARHSAPAPSAERHTKNEQKTSRCHDGGSVDLLGAEDRDHRTAPRPSAVAGATGNTSGGPGGGGAPGSSRPGLQSCRTENGA